MLAAPKLQSLRLMVVVAAALPALIAALLFVATLRLRPPRARLREAQQ